VSGLDSTPAGLPERAPLEGRFVRLEPLQPNRHAAGLYRAGHDHPEAARIWDFLPYGPFADEADMRGWLDRQAESLDPLFFACVEAATGRPLGMLSFLRMTPAMRTIEIGHIWFGPQAQRTRANTEACHLMIAAAVERWGYRRVEWKCNARNRRSRLAALRLGFSFEGIFRQHMIVRGENRDSAWFGLTDRAWPAIKACHRNWLESEGEAGSLARMTAPLLDTSIRDFTWSVEPSRG